MQNSIQEIAKIISADIDGYQSYTHQFWRIETDSRHITYPEETIFVAIKGTHHNGIQFIPDLIKKGVKFFIVDQDIKPTKNITIIKVKNCLEAIQQLATSIRTKISIPTIAITGSNGKTIIKEWLSQILSHKYSICKNPKSYNSQLGVALSVLQLKDFHELGIFEAGISQTDEMSKLREIIQPNFGILSNLGDAHDSGFTTRKNKLEEKIKLFESCEYFYYCGDDSFLHCHLKYISNARSWGKENFNSILIEIQEENKIIINKTGQVYNFNLPFKDNASIENIIPCILISLDFKATQEEIQSSLFTLQRHKMRLEQKEGINGSILINDSYSLDIASLKISFQFADQQNKTFERVLIISDFPSSKNQFENYNELTKLIKNYNFKTIIAVGKNFSPQEILNSNDYNIHQFETTEILIRNLHQLNFNKKLVLIKGARSFKLERVFNELSLSNHESILEINLKAIAHNIAIYKEYLKPNIKIIAVVKASSYGSGNYEIAKFLEHLGVSILAVAYQDEAISLRNQGIQSPIMVMNSGLSDFEKLAEQNIDPVIFNLQQFQKLIQESTRDQEIRIHLKLDTGMNRLGFKDYEIKELLKLIKEYSFVKIISIFSHLSASDSIEFNDFTKSQFKKFENLYSEICKVISYKPWAHILNSGGISEHPEMQLDMVRIGIGMYGIDNNHILNLKLDKVHTLRTKITQIKKVKAVEKISYNLSGQLNDDGVIGILSIGYADGLPRSAGLNQYEVFIKGKKCKLVGAVCMDMCMIDLSQLQEVQVGDDVEIFGTHSTIESLSSASGRIPYEILCGISARVKRVYVEE